MRARHLSVICPLALVISAAACAPAPGIPASSSSAATSAVPAIDEQLRLVWTLTGEPNTFNTPDGVAVDPRGYLYVMDAGNDRVQKFDLDGKFIAMWGSHGRGEGQFDCAHVCMIAANADGNIFVTDIGNARVQEFDGQGTFLATWGSFGSGDGQFYDPFGIAVDQQGHVFVTDAAKTRVQEFDANGAFVAAWGKGGSEPGQFSSDLADIAVDSAGNVYVTDRTNGVQKFDHNGNFLEKLAACGDEPPGYPAAGVTFDSAGNLYVSSISSNRLCKYDASGHFLAAWDNSGDSSAVPSSVGGIAVDTQGNLYTGELFTGLVRKLAQP